jgi:uncharacterized membrane protein YozB (DUF420 family)
MNVDFPSLNASLNAAAGVLLVAGYGCIRRRLVRAHAACMLSALLVSSAFLACYLYYHIAIRRGASTSFRSQAPEAPEWVALVYYALLLTHVVLAVATVPLALFTAWKALQGQFAKHVRIARWTLPIWLYVSVTGVVVYWMLYRMYTSG